MGAVAAVGGYNGAVAVKSMLATNYRGNNYYFIELLLNYYGQNYLQFGLGIGHLVVVTCEWLRSHYINTPH